VVIRAVANLVVRAIVGLVPAITLIVSVVAIDMASSFVSIPSVVV
jgi:hypothetical protein